MLRCLKTGNVLCRFVSYALSFMCKILAHHIDDASSFMCKICAPMRGWYSVERRRTLYKVLPICGLTWGASDSLKQVVCLGELKVGFRGGYE